MDPSPLTQGWVSTERFDVDAIPGSDAIRVAIRISTDEQMWMDVMLVPRRDVRVSLCLRSDTGAVDVPELDLVVLRFHGEDACSELERQFHWLGVHADKLRQPEDAGGTDAA